MGNENQIKLIAELQTKIRENLEKNPKADIRGLSAELAYVERVGGHLKGTERMRIRLRWGLGCEAVKQVSTFVDVAPILAELRSPAPIPTVSKRPRAGMETTFLALEPPAKLPAHWRREKALYERFCVHCDGEMEEQPVRRFRCVNLACFERERAA